MLTRKHCILPVLALLVAALSCPSADAGLFKELEKGAKKVGGALEKEAGKAARTLRKEAGKAKKTISQVGDDLDDAANNVGRALKDLNPQVSPYARARVSGNSVQLTIGANVSVAGERFSVELFNGYVKKTKKSFRVERTVKKGKFRMKVALDISWHGDRIVIRPKARIGKLPVPMPVIRVKA